jgi:hypothetical protein
VVFLGVTVTGYCVRGYLVNSNLREMIELQRHEAMKAQQAKRVLSPLQPNPDAAPGAGKAA